MKSFLVVDDDSDMTALYEVLIKRRYDDSLVSMAHNGEEALSKAIASDYSVIISDLDMRPMNGIDFYLNMKKESSQLAQRTAFITAAPNIPYFKKEKVPWLLKPFGKNDFYSLVDAMLAREEKNVSKEMGYALERMHERRKIKEECILEPLNMYVKSRGLIKGTIIDMSEGGFGFVHKGDPLVEKFKVTVSVEPISASERKAEMVWAYRSDGEVRSGFRWI